MTVSGPWWAWALGATVFLLLQVVIILTAAHVVLGWRLREIKAMFRDALAHAKSFDPRVERLQRERDDDRRMLDEEILPALTTMQEKQIDHENRLATLESRPGLVLGRGAGGHT